MENNDMLEQGLNTRLEPILSEEQNKEKAVFSLLHPKPDFKSLGRSQVLDKVAKFLPVMSGAEAELQRSIREGLGDRFNVENVEGDANVIEMDVAMLNENGGGWTSDSESDSTPSPSDDNDFTSDTDVSSTTSCSSSSCSSDNASTRRNKDRSTASSKKRPLIQEISDAPPKSFKPSS